MALIGNLLESWRSRKQRREQDALMELKARYHAFRIFLENNGLALELIVNLDNLLNTAEQAVIESATEDLLGVTGELVDGLNLLSDESFSSLYGFHGKMANQIKAQLGTLNRPSDSATSFCIALDELQQTAFHLTGLKAGKLGRLKQMALPVPDGFICTTQAARCLLSAGNLSQSIQEQVYRLERQRIDAGRIADTIRDLIIATPLPEKVCKALEQAYDRLAASSNRAAPFISVRSSGVSEDGADFSFAGQFTSILNVSGLPALFEAFKEVVASGFSSRALMYRINAGMAAFDCDIAVLCQIMVDADCAGVLFTHDPSAPDSGRMLISAVPGLGTTAVGGSAPADLYRPSRLETIKCIDDSDAAQCGLRINETTAALELFDHAEIGHKTFREISDPSGGLRREPFPPELADQPLLSVRSLAELIRLSKIIESVENGPQDIEWANSAETGIAILQTRPLRLATGSKGPRVHRPPIAAPRVSGTCASSGRTVGRVRLVHSATELRQFADLVAGGQQHIPYVLAIPNSIVDAAEILNACAGVIVSAGNPTDHLSCIAREYGIPMITGAQNSFSCLDNDQWVIVDADSGMVLDAPESVWAPIAAETPQTRPAEPESAAAERRPAHSRRQEIAPERQALRRMIVPLNLTDAYGPTFSRQECRSLHDIIRYTHEMAVLAMFDAGDLIMEEAGDLLHPLNIGVPFSFLVIDVGGGLRRPRKTTLRQHLKIARPLNREDVLSVPLAALCDGLVTPGLNWAPTPDASALSGILSRTMLDARGARPAGSFNYALAARDYVNLNARVEFHFAMLDAVCGRDAHANYIRFRFKGGGAGMERSTRRAEFLRLVLEGLDFYTSVVGDLVTASLTGSTRDLVQQRLVMLGRLLGFSRFLDGVMNTDEIPSILADAFLDGQLDARSAVSDLQGDDNGIQTEQTLSDQA